MTRPVTVPPAAERFNAFTYLESERKPSALVPGAEQIEPHLRCPRCGHTRPTPTPDRTVNCGGCGLAMHMTGGFSLYIWECEPETAS